MNSGKFCTLTVVKTIAYSHATEVEDRAIREIVALAMDAPAKAKSGHPGTAMALAPLAVTLFSRVLRHHPTDPTWLDRDRFILSCGHASILQYGIVRTFGYGLSREDLMEFRQPHSRTPGHPEAGMTPTVEVTTGPLGQGIANGVGMAMAERVLRAQFGSDLVDHRVWVVAGDGCIEEGISHEAASLAGALGLGRLNVIYDDNRITIDGDTSLALADDTPARFRAYGWHVLEIGEVANDLAALEQALLAARDHEERPTLIVLRSHIGYPAPSMTDRREAHGSPFNAETIAETKSLLGLDPSEAFAVSDELPMEMVESLVAQREAHQQWVARFGAAGERGQALRAQCEAKGALSSALSLANYEAGTKVATRKAMQRLMDAVANAGPGVVAGSADLTENTGVVLPGSTAQSAHAPEGRQVYYGIREFAMGAAMVGMARHGGIRPVGSTFFVFSDYVRPAIRLAALSEAPTLFVFTHDSVAVGEDGPTHQPIEHLAALRAMPGLHVVRPSDANETLLLGESVLRNADMAPTALVLTRQDVVVMDAEASTASQQGALRGGYVARENTNAVMTLVATGSEVPACLSAADLLQANGIAVRVVALPCWTCFEEQETDYRSAVLGTQPRLSVEAASTFGWAKYATHHLGIDTFGLSAPGDYALDYFKMTPEGVAGAVRDLLENS